MEVYEVIFSSPELKTVADYVAEPGSPASKFINREEEFLKVKNKEGKTNKEVILSRYKYQKSKDKYSKVPAKELPLKVGTKLAIPVLDVDRVGLLTQGIEVVSNDIPAFKARALAELEEKEGYNPVRKTKPIKGALNVGVLSESFPEVTVWVWCRALSDSKLHEENKGQIFNITPFVQKVVTNVGKNGGNFQMVLPPLTCELDENDNWIIKKASLTTYKNTANNLSIQNDGYVASSSLLTEEYPGGEVRRSRFLFHNILSPNDLVFIRFETLQLEQQQRIDDNKNFIVDKSQLPGRIYDMIGLIDDNTEVVNGASNDVSININGRDLSKLFIEDGTYFYALEMSQGQLNFAGGSTQQNELMQRVFSDNALQYFGLYFNNSIENVLKFVIQQLSTIKVVPNDLFEHYGERRNEKYNPERKQVQQKQTISNKLEELKNTGLRYIIDIRKQAQLTEVSKNQENKQAETVWKEGIAFFKAIREQKVRTVAGSLTTGWSAFKYSTSKGLEQVRENTLPAFFYSNTHLTLFYTKATVIKQNEDLLFKTIDEYLDLQSASPDHKNIWKKEFASGIWQIIKLVIDEGITERRIVDSSASSANGSLLNFIRKVCQEPFVEFYMDTYGDMYHLIARKPPTDREGMLSMLEGQVSVEGNEGEKKITSTVIDIEIEDVIQEQLTYDDRTVVSWYQLTPQANFIGNSSTYSLAYLPAIFFQEYADIWGSRPLQVVHNYMPHLPLNAQQTNLDISEKQAYEDIKYLVESHAYLPFTRSGTITINGDRRLKVGNICRYKPTGEIFFINDVQQTFQISESFIERTTTLEVSRGMIEDLITGISFTDEKNTIFKTASYFDIINTELVIEERTVTDTITEQVQVGTKTVPQYTTPNNNYSQSSNLQVGALFAAANKYKGYKYGLGSNGAGGKIDCSAFVTKVLQMCGVKVSRDTSENLMTRSNNFRVVPRLEEGSLFEGDVIGFDTGRTSFDKGRKYGIDHIAIVVRNYNTGGLELAESVGKVGVRSRPLSQAIPRYNKISRVIYVGDFRGGGEIKYGSSIEQPVYENRTRTVTRKEIDRAKVFSNFKVFTECFNFLLRRRQNDIGILGSTNYLKPVLIEGKPKDS